MPGDFSHPFVSRFAFSKRRRRRSTQRKRAAKRRKPSGFNPRFQPLEPRLVLATVVFDVTTTSDDFFDDTPGLSLREAIYKAHHEVAAEDDVVINLQPGVTYEITRPTVASGVQTENDAALDPAWGDFDISRNLVVTATNGRARIDANQLGRVFQISGGAAVTISNVHISFGQAPEIAGVSQGGAIHISGASQVSLVDLTVEQNIARGRVTQGGAVYVDNSAGRVNVVRSDFFFNGALSTEDSSPGDALGGAFYVERGRVSFEDSNILINVARADSASNDGAIAGGRALGGGIAIGLGFVELVRTTLDENKAEGGDGSENSGTAGAGGAALGGAVYVGASGLLVAQDSVFTGNQAEAGDGGESRGFVGGAGGNAFGGAIFLDAGSEAEISGGRVEGNSALGGRGGSGQDGGGAGGGARGGAVAMADGSQANPPELRFDTVALIENAAVGGRGGTTTESGPAGHGGAASGGAIYSTSGLVRLEHSPLVTNRAEGGAGGNATKGRSGNGGAGHGGAIYVGGSAQLTVVSTLSIDGPTEDPEFVDSTGLMIGNLALGGHGGHKLNASADSSDDAGDGGWAQGGAIAALTSAPIHLFDVALFNNGALAGNGGHGNVFASQGGFGTAGGDAGQGRGGALYTETTTTLENVAFFGNTAAGGRLESTPQEGAFAGGQAGVGNNLQGLNGGAGGRAVGGAVYIGAGDLIVRASGFAGNKALGANGGGGGNALNLNNDLQGRNGGHGGAGGNAFGGAIRAETSGQLDITESLFAGNLALAGRGGTGGLGASGVHNGGAGGNGGNGGVAAGGAISVHPVSNPSAPTSVTIHETLIVGNKAIAGDGGFAGNGGAGNERTGGAAGSGGDGGRAVGGGLDLNTVDALISFTTIEQNVASSGWGAGGGHAGSGAWYGAIDTVGRGGHGGDALGGGLALQNGDLSIHTSTVVQNEAFAGFGGHGAWGGHGHFGGGNGAQGGNSGNARGGGIYHNGPQERLTVYQATVAQNRLFVGNGGFGGKGGLRVDSVFLDSDVPTHYEVDPFSPVPVLSGAASVLRPEIGYLSQPPGFISIPLLQGGFNDPNLAILGLDGQSLDSIGSLSLAAAIPILTAGIGASAIATATATSVVVFTGGGVALSGIGGGPALVSVSGLSAGGFALTFGAFSVGGAILSIGAVVATRAIWAGIETGDWEASFAWSLGAPGEVSGVAISVLLSGVFPNEEEDPPEVFGDGANGVAGADGVAEGTNIYGAARIGRTLAAEGEAIQRTRSRVVAPPALAPHAYWISESVTELSLADVAGGTYESIGPNLIGAVDSGFETDLHGTTAEPLDARLDEHTRYNGGLTPTLRLLPGSPARGLTGGSSVTQSQNHYEWGFFYDIGAWGHGFNQPPTAVDDSFTIAAGETLSFSPEQLLANDFDVDGDPLHVQGNDVIGVAQNGTLVKQTIIFADGTVFTTFIYTPNPGFAGTETFTYVLTDGELFDTGTITIEVLPPPPLEVVEVRVFGSEWNQSNPALLGPVSLVVGSDMPLPWVNLDTIEVTFSEDVNVTVSSLALVGVNVSDYISTGSGVTFAYDPTTFTATWTFASPLGVDRLLLNLESESGDAHPITAASDGRLLVEGDFAVEFSVLPGDVNGDGSVSVTDLVIIAQTATASGGATFPANYDPRIDVNGDGAIDTTDRILATSYMTQQLPTGSPELPGGGGMTMMAIDAAPLSSELAVDLPLSIGAIAHAAAAPLALTRTAPSTNSNGRVDVALSRSGSERAGDRASPRDDVLAVVLEQWERDDVFGFEADLLSSIGDVESDESDHLSAVELSLKEFNNAGFDLDVDSTGPGAKKRALVGAR